MWLIIHDAIVITSYQLENIYVIRNIAQKYFWDLVSGIIESDTNWYVSFLISPDWSKEWRDTSDKFDENRDLFIEEARKAYEKWAYFDGVHIRYWEIDKPIVVNIIEDVEE